jgi:hypothetical protein
MAKQLGLDETQDLSQEPILAPHRNGRVAFQSHIPRDGDNPD